MAPSSGSVREADEAADDPALTAPSASAAHPLIELSSGSGRAAEAAHRLDRAWLLDRLREAADALETAVARASIRLLDDGDMSAMHERHLGVAGTTDVITFATAAAPPESGVEVDLAIGIETAQREATKRGHSVEREVLLYALHGLLHAAGHDDQDEAAYRAMHAEEDRILEAIGVGATFGSGRTAAAEAEAGRPAARRKGAGPCGG